MTDTPPAEPRRVSSLARHLLCAVPQLQDPNFRRSVVLMLEHNEDGALGLVLNNPLPNSMVDVAESLGLVWDGDPEATIRLGGPVEPMRAWILHDQLTWDDDASELLPGVMLTTSLEHIRGGEGGEPREIGGEGAQMIMLHGYAGWASSQIEGEIAAGSWVAVPIKGANGEPAGPDARGVDPMWLFRTPPEDMWDESLRSIGVDPGRLVGLKGGTASLH
jgi:putative transcriptional regulator